MIKLFKKERFSNVNLFGKFYDIVVNNYPYHKKDPDDGFYYTDNFSDEVFELALMEQTGFRFNSEGKLVRSSGLIKPSPRNF